MVLRNPVDRFLSLYFDKVAGEGHKRFVPLRKVLIDKRNLESSPTLAREHLRNCNILIDWIEENLASKIDLQPDPHWTPQKYRFGIIRDLNLKVLTLNGLESKLALLISDIVPHARSLMSGIERYSSNSSFKTNEVLDKQIKAKINSVYERDRDVFEHVRDLWRDLSPGSGLEIPRASDLFQN